MARLRTAGLVALVALAGYAPQAAATCEPATTPAYINLTEFGWPDCTIPLPPGLVFVPVKLQSIGLTRVSFSVPHPPGGTVLGGNWNYPATGDPISGIEFDLGGCVAGANLGYLIVVLPQGTPPGCSPWKVNDGAVVEDCEGNVLPATSPYSQASVNGGFCNMCCMECCASLPAYNLLPPDGATGLPLNMQLSWDGTWDIQDEFGHNGCFVEIGTDPDCATWTRFEPDCAAQIFAPDFLQPGTTYYWRVVWQPDPARCYGVTAPRSFTTTGPVATQAATWGRVKAMYRE